MDEPAAREFRILGPVEVVDRSGAAVPVRGAKQRALLAALLVRAGQVVPADVLIEEIWNGEAPAHAANALQAHVSALRKLLGRGAIATRPPGYVLQVEPGRIDAARFERLVERGSALLAAGAAREAATITREALALWRGAALADVAYEPFAQAEAAQLEELRAAAIEQRIEAELTLGRHADLLPELEALVARHPLRERLRAQLMLALYRAGRQAEALQAYRDARRALNEQLGLEPTPALQQLERAILRQEPSLAARPRADEAPIAGREPELRRTVTIVVCDVVPEDPRLDPEARRAAVGRGLAAAEAELAARGAAVDVSGERTIAVFGGLVAREDDVSRALQAAASLDAAVAAANAGPPLAVRVGVETGRALTGTSVSGAVLREAAALADAASPGSVLIGPSTRRAADGAVSVEPVDAGFHLVHVLPDPPPPTGPDTPLVGREHELSDVGRALERARRERRPLLVTVVGEAGIGKTRLAAELTARFSAEAIVLRGRCRPYGPALQPIADALEGHLGEPLEETVAARLADLPDAEAVAGRLTAALGLSEGQAMADETAWAVRTAVAELARDRPLVLVLDDLHLASEPLLDVVESVAALVRDTAILILCLARPELYEDRPAWGGGRSNAVSLELGPLSEAETRAFAAALAGEDLTERVVAQAADVSEGNPLFLEQLLAGLAETGGDEPDGELPARIESVLAARLDRVSPGEAAVLEQAAVLGREFERDALAGIPDAASSLVHLVRRGLVWPVPRAGGRNECFRFHHALLWEAAYARIPKARRAVLHERVAARLDEARTPVAGWQELAGRHLERAHAYRLELGERGPELDALGARAAGWLAIAGRQAFARDDGPAAGELLERAATLLPDDAAERLDLLVDAAEALREAGENDRARGLADEALAQARASASTVHAARALVVRLRLRWQTEAHSPDTLVEELDGAIDELERAGDSRGLARALSMRAGLAANQGRLRESERLLERAIELARAAGDARAESYATDRLLGILATGPMPADEALRRCRDVLDRTPGARRMAATANYAIGYLLAGQGRFAEARGHVDRATEIATGLGQRPVETFAAHNRGEVELLAGNPEAAEREFAAARAASERLGELLELELTISAQARAALALGRVEAALGLTEEAERHTSPTGQVAWWRSVRAVALARLGRHDEAVVLAREAVRAHPSELVIDRAEATAELAEVLALAGRTDEARQARDEAIELFERKGMTVSAERLRANRSWTGRPLPL